MEVGLELGNRDSDLVKKERIRKKNSQKNKLGEMHHLPFILCAGATEYLFLLCPSQRRAWHCQPSSDFGCEDLDFGDADDLIDNRGAKQIGSDRIVMWTHGRQI
jgi:hypothetical protein